MRYKSESIKKTFIMKLITLLSLASFIYLATACGQTYQEDTYIEDSYEYEEEFTETQGQFENNMTTRNTSNSSNITMRNIKDPQTGMVVCQMLLPANWQENPNGFTSPEGTKTEAFQIETNNFKQNWLNSADAVLQQKVLPLLQQIGGKIKNTYRVPEIAAMDKRRDQMYWKGLPVQSTFDALAIELEHEGNESIVILHFNLSQSQYGNYSVCSASQLTAKPQFFERDKKIFINALSNIKLNPQYIAMCNQREQQRTQTAWNNHNQRMSNNQAHFNAMNKIHQDTYSSLNQMSMDTYRNNNAASDRMQDQFVNGIWEQQNMQNPYTGENVKVDAGYNQYYMNNNNEYIGTDDYMYNPNLDPNINNTEWRKVQPENKSNY